MGRELQQAKSIARLERVGNERGLALINELAVSDGKFVFYRCKREHTVKVKRSSTYSRHWAGQCEHCVYEDRLAELERIASEHGGRILPKDSALGTRDWVEIECANAHRSKKRVYSVLQGTWCAECFFDSIRSTIDDAREYAKTYGGKCLSRSCEGGSERLDWECGEGHEWTSSLNDERAFKRFCPICKISTAKSDETTKCRSKDKMLMRAHKVAASHGGKCLSSTFTTTRDKMEWECAEGHQWWAPAQTVLYNGAWCNICSMKKRPGAITIEKLQEHASSRGGELVSDVYQRNDIKLDWRCEDGHEFKRSWMVMRKTKNFCPHCMK